MIINTRVRTEYSLRFAFGKLNDAIAMQGDTAVITDRHGTWGHIKFKKECEKQGKKAVYGVELGVVTPENVEAKRRRPDYYVTLLARNNEGLKEVYRLTSLATSQFYYQPRLHEVDIQSVSDNVYLIIDGDCRVDFDNNEFIRTALTPSNRYALENHYPKVACCDNLYLRPDQKEAYEVTMGNDHSENFPCHLLDQWEWASSVKDVFPALSDSLFETAIVQMEHILNDCNATIENAEIVEPDRPASLLDMCKAGALKKDVDLSDEVYSARLERELGMIKEKGFEDYFYLVADLVTFAKSKMMVGPARGSSCGSLVCYLLDITGIDPIPYDLIFERFIDINRDDYPDIDIDFTDHKRELVFEYLREKYGEDRVARIGTVSFFKPKSALTDVAKCLRIPLWEVNEFKDRILTRSSGDARSNDCLLDSFEQVEQGRSLLKKYPELVVAAKIEGHARHSGQHAAGMLVTKYPITNYCAIDHKTGAAMLDKKDAEAIDLLKIDALGLTTLSVLEDTLEMAGLPKDYLETYPMDDENAFKIIRERKYTGIFQFEGMALQFVAGQISLDCFGDIAALTALARPGPLGSGMEEHWSRRRMGKEAIDYPHEIVKPYLEETLGVTVYQEQVMQIARVLGKLRWEDVSALRRAMSKSMGIEFFDKYWNVFKKGAMEHGLDEESARSIWDSINSFGSWAFNKSHAVAYGMISYWCAALKAAYPLEFSCAALMHGHNEEKVTLLLRELRNEGIPVVVLDPEKSKENWSIQDGVIYGGITNVKGIGQKLAKDIIKRRENGEALTPRQHSLLTEGSTPYDDIFQGETLWGHIYANPRAYEIHSDLEHFKNISIDNEGTFVFIAKIQKKNIRSLNEVHFVEDRGGTKLSLHEYMTLILADDTGTLLAAVNPKPFKKYRTLLLEDMVEGDWAIWKGFVKGGRRKFYVNRIAKLKGNKKYELHS